MEPPASTRLPSPGRPWHARRRQRTGKTPPLVVTPISGFHPRLLLFQQRGKCRLQFLDCQDKDSRSKTGSRNCGGPEVVLNFVRRDTEPLVRSHRRQTMLSPEPPPSDSGGHTATGCQALFLPSRGTHFRKRSRLSGQGATLATACAVPDGLRSYRPVGQTLFTESPPLPIYPHGATRHGQERGSPFRLQLLRSVAPLSQQND